MNKRYLPAIASLLIIAIALTSFLPVFAALPTMLVAQPTLRVTTIAEDDELRADRSHVDGRLVRRCFDI